MSGPGDVTYFIDAATQQYVSDITAVSIMKTAGPMMLGLVVLEALISVFSLQKTHRLNDTINSISHGFIERAWSRLTSKTLEFGVYCYIYAHWAPYHLDENVWTGVIAFLGVDCAYYWFHRMAHEINLFWATHSVHHSSEEYNLATAMRQSVVQTYCSWMFYLPMALIVPPRLFYVHLQINLIYQFWIHTRMVGNLGVLEYILNTPSHHRVHHGRNPRYLDRNYGGVLIIWDRLFGTFQVEDEEVYYGLVHPSQAFDIWQGQFAHFIYMFGRIREERGFWNKWSVVWKGPGWRAGAPRMGFASDIPEIDTSKGKYLNPKLPRGHYWYLLLNFVSITLFAIFVNMGLLQTRSHTILTPKNEIIEDNLKGYGQKEATSFEEEIYLQPDGGMFYMPSYFWHAVLIGIFTASLQSFALLTDRWRYAEHFEAARCAFFLGLDVFCYITSAPGEHRIFWYTDPAKRFTAWSVGFVFLRLNLFVSFLYMAWYVFDNTRKIKVHYPTRPSMPQVATNDVKEEDEKMHHENIKDANKSQKKKNQQQRRKLKVSDNQIVDHEKQESLVDEIEKKKKDDVDQTQEEKSKSGSASSSPSAGGERLPKENKNQKKNQKKKNQKMMQESSSQEASSLVEDSVPAITDDLILEPNTVTTTITTTIPSSDTVLVDILSEESSRPISPPPLSSSFERITKAGIPGSPQTGAKSRSNKSTRAFSTVGVAI